MAPALSGLMTKGVLPVRIIVCSLWLMAAGAGYALLFNGQSGKGPAGKSPEHRPSNRDDRAASTNRVSP